MSLENPHPAASSKSEVLNATATPSAAASRARWGGLSAAAPAAMLLALCLVARRATPPLALVPGDGSAVLASATAIQHGIVLPSQTMVVSAKKVSGSALLHGRLQPAVSVAGKAPLSGQVARVLVREGQSVQVNDRVLQISTGPTSRPPSSLERSQDAAESAQVRAVGQQTALQQRMSGAQARLKAAQERVASARARVESAQQIVRRLRRGETVSIPNEGEGEAPPRAVSIATASRSASRDGSRDRDATRDRDTARDTTRSTMRESLRESQNAQRLAEQTAARAGEASHAADEADKMARLKTQKLAEVRTAAEIVQKRLAEGAAKAADAEAARASVSEAEGEAAAARLKAAAARKEANTLETAAIMARTQARTAAAQASRALQKLQLFAGNPAPGAQASNAPPPRVASSRREEPGGAASVGAAPGGAAGKTQDETRAGAAFISVAQAARLVREAMAESIAAIRAARRIKVEADEYEQQVRSTKRRLDASGENLQAAQQRVMDYTIQANLSAVRAPSSGVVLSVAPIAQEISAGETIVVIGRSDLFQARFADYSGAWKHLKPGDLLPAVVQKPIAPARPTSAAPRGASTVKAIQGMPVMARLRAVTPPRRSGEPAILETVIFNPRRASGPVSGGTGGRAARRFRPGMTILCSVDKPGERTVISVPSAAVLRGGTEGRGMIAVLRPAPLATDEEIEATQGEAETEAGDEAQNEASPAEQNGAQGEYRIEWRSVALGASDGVQQEIVAGLATGERVALQPAALRVFGLSYGPQATVRMAIG